MAGLRKPERLTLVLGAVLIAAGFQLAAAYVVVAAGREPVTLMGLTFPAQIADAQIDGTHNFEKTNPGLGHSVAYLRPGWKVDVYIYDLRTPSIPDNPESKIVKGQLKQATNDIFEAGRRGTYDNVELKHEFSVADPEDRTRFVCSAFAYVHKSAGDVDSFLCLASWQGKFVKFRMTTRRNANAQNMAKNFVDAWIALLWPGG